jgi:hypothetical protein
MSDRSVSAANDQREYRDGVMNNLQSSGGRFVECVWNEGYEVDLELHKQYEMIPDPRWEARGFVRVIDESGEDYVYHSRYFAIPDPAEKAEGKPVPRDP